MRSSPTSAHVFRGREEDAIAIVHASELRPQAELSWGELRDLTGAIAAGLRGLGVGPGDRVAGYLPNIPEAVAAFFACASIGAVWSCCSPDFGARSVVDRFAQIEPKVLFCVDGYRYGGRDFPRGEVVAQLAREIPSLEHVVLLPYLDPDAAIVGTVPLGSLLQPAPLEFEQLPFDHPLWVLYSSGTTGLPKAIVHGQGGILLEHLKALHLHTDARPGRPALLVHDDRLDDVELPRRRPPHRRGDRALRREPDEGALGPRRVGRDHLLRDERRVHPSRA